MVQVPTHINPSGFDSLLDLVLVSDSDRVSSCLPIPPLANSDHLGLCLLLFTSVPRNFSCKTPRVVWDYQCADFSKACDLLDNVDWDSVLASGDIKGKL